MCYSQSKVEANTTMRHRHLNHEGLTLAAVDDVIDRGSLNDWLDLRAAVVDDQNVREDVLRICAAHTGDPYAQRYHFWEKYAQRTLA